MQRPSSSGSLISESLEDYQCEGMLSQVAFDSRFHLKDKFEDDYEQIQRDAGRGVSGPVRLCQRIGESGAADAPLRCCKELRKRPQCGGDQEEREDELKAEISIYFSVDHPNIAKLLDVYEDDSYIFLVMEFCSGGTLKGRIDDARKKRGAGGLDEDVAQHYTLQLLLALCHCHHRGIAHRDVKPLNLLLADESDDAPLKLIDFGYSVTCPDIDTGDMMRGAVGTPAYLAPEAIDCRADNGKWYSEQCDLWSTGATVFAMLCGSEAFYAPVYAACGEEDDDPWMHTILEGRYNFDAPAWSTVSDDAKDFVRRCLTVDPAKRITARQALQHPWICDLFRARSALLDESDELGKWMVDSFNSFIAASRLMRSSMQTVSYSKPAAELRNLQRIFGAFDMQANGELDIADFKGSLRRLGVQLDDDNIEQLFDRLRAPVDHSERDTAYTLKHSEFVAALLPITGSDAFFDANQPQPESPEMQHQGKMPLKQRRMSSHSLNELRLDWSQPMESLEAELPPNYSGSMNASMTVLQLVRQMSQLHYRSVVVRRNRKEYAFFDVMDLNNLLLSKIDCIEGEPGAADLQEALDFVAGAPCSLVANTSSRSAFVPLPMTCGLRDVCSTMMRDDVRRVPLVQGAKEEPHRVFSAADALSLALRFPEWVEVLKSMKADVFVNQEKIKSVCVAGDETIISALRKMDNSRLTLCPVINSELSSLDAEGAVAVGVVAASDLKHVLLHGDAATLAMTVLDFIAWRSVTKLAHNVESASEGKSHSKNRFPYVSVGADQTLYHLARKLLATNLQRIFLSSEKLHRVVGVVSARDILKVAWPMLSQTEPGMLRGAPSSPGVALLPDPGVSSLHKRRSGDGRRLSWADEDGRAALVSSSVDSEAPGPFSPPPRRA